MSPLLEQTQEETDPEVLKKARAVAKGQVTTLTNKLKLLMEGKSYEDVDILEAKEILAKLLTTQPTLEVIHERFQLYRLKEPDEVKEEEEVLKQSAYLQTVEDGVRQVKKMLTPLENAYEEFVKEHAAKNKKTKDQQNMLSESQEIKEANKDAEEDFRADLSIGLAIVSSDDKADISSAGNVRVDLEKGWKTYEKTFKTYRSLLIAQSTEEAVIEQQAEKFREHLKNYKQVRQKLSGMETVSQKADELERLSVSAVAQAEARGPLHNSTMRENAEGAPSCIKIEKARLEKFSGKARDYPSFRKLFQSVINVPSRPRNEVGLSLFNAIPQAHRHLIQNIDLEQPERMLAALDSKWGSAKTIVDAVLSELRSLKMPSHDKQLIAFIEAIEKGMRDLEAVDMMGEVTNATVIAELEKRLPPSVAARWTKKYVAQEMSKRKSDENFKAFMLFLKQVREEAEYSTAEVRASEKTKTQTNYVTGHGAFAGEDKTENDKTDKRNFRAPPVLARRSRWPCLACKRNGKRKEEYFHFMGSCPVWEALGFQKRQQLGAATCQFHPGEKHTTEDCTDKPTLYKCRHCGEDPPDHTFAFCRKFKTKSNVGLAGRGQNLVGQQSLAPVILKKSILKGPQGASYGTLFDDASTDNYVTHEAAAKWNLKAVPVELEVDGIGGVTTELKTSIYSVKLLDIKGEVHTIQCFGFDQICKPSAQIRQGSYEQLCRKLGIHEKKVKRPEKIDLLISMRDHHLHPTTEVKSLNKLVHYSGILGNTIAGQHNLLRFKEGDGLYPARAHIAQTFRADLEIRREILQETSTYTAKASKECVAYFEEENIGADILPQCGSCRCGRCSQRNKVMSLREEKEYGRLRDCLEHSTKGSEEDPGPYWTAGFPWVIDKELLENNETAVMGVMNSTKRRLEKNKDWQEIYETQLKELVRRGFAREVFEDEMKAWKKLKKKVHFISHQIVTNAENKSTPFRVVFNSSQKHKGQSLNLSLAKGPDVLNTLHGVLLRFREEVTGAQGDISKMFYMVRIAKPDQMCQLWRWHFKGEQQVRTFCMTRLVMGNKPSSNLSIIALKETAMLDSNEEDFPEAYTALVLNSYVDNVFVVAPDHESLQSAIKETEKVAGLGGFFFKEWIISGGDSEERPLVKVDGEGEEKALGMMWEISEDKFYVRGADRLPPESVELSPRLCLAGLAAIFDPLGLVQPFTVNGKKLFRTTLQVMKDPVKKAIQWDKPITATLSKAWHLFFANAAGLKEIRFPRSFKPPKTDPDCLPDLATFMDGGPEMYGTCAYAIWTMLDKSRISRLVMSKARLGPVSHQGETVKMELSSATIQARMKEFLEAHLSTKFAHHYPILDSRIVQAMILRESYSLNTFAGLRVAEINQKTITEDYLWVESKENIADILTRGSSPRLLGEGSRWQTGPAWLALPTSEWPTVKSSKVLKAEEEVEAAKFTRKCAVTLSAMKKENSEENNAINKLTKNCSTLLKLLRVMALVRRIVRFRFKQACRPWYRKVVSVSEQDEAWKALIQNEQKHLMMKPTKRLVTRAVEISGEHGDTFSYLCLAGRVRQFPLEFTQESDIPLLPAGELAKLFVTEVHNRYHRDIATTVAIARRSVWIIKVKKIATIVDRKCVTCKQLRAVTEEQIMGKLPQDRVTFSPPFSVVAMDLWGPIWIRDDVVKRGRRVKKKVYGVVYTCLVTRAVYLDICTGYDTESLLHTLRRLMSVRGAPKTIYSDPATSLVCADKEMRSWRQDWNEEDLQKFGANQGITWKFIMAGSQHQNGAAESLVKMIKKNLKTCIGETVLNLNELNTVLLEVANLINERPIGQKPNEDEDSEFLTPNHFLLGRATARIPGGPFRTADAQVTQASLRDRFYLVQSLVKQFWSSWIKTFFPSLLVQEKWHTQRRNLMVNDVCLVQDSQVFRGQWRLGRVTEVFADREGIVRNVQLVISPAGDGKRKYVPKVPATINRHISKLIVLVPADEQEQE